MGKRDILATALGKEPRRGHMQGTGKYLNKSIYYHLFTGRQYNEGSKSTWQTEIEARIDEIASLLRRTPGFSDVDSCSYVPTKSKGKCGARVKVGVCVAGEGGEVYLLIFVSNLFVISMFYPNICKKISFNFSLTSSCSLIQKNISI